MHDHESDDLNDLDRHDKEQKEHCKAPCNECSESDTTTPTFNVDYSKTCWQVRMYIRVHVLAGR